jgi:hypothetical protein
MYRQALSLQYYKKIVMPIEFDQFLGFLAFAGILLIGFWLMIFLTVFAIPYWITGSLLEKIKMKKEAKRLEKENRV